MTDPRALHRRDVLQGLATCAACAACGDAPHGATSDTSDTSDTPGDTSDTVDTETDPFAHCHQEPTEGWASLPLSAAPALETVGGSALVTVAGRSLLVARADADCVVAVSPICTHQGCTIAYQHQYRRFKCPCHSAIFTEEGVVVGGPAPTDIDAFPAALQGDTVRIQVG